MVPPRLRNIGMVFQSYAVWPHMTVRQNVAYPLRHRRVPRAEIERKIADMLDLVGLSELAQRAVVALSGGQMQRVALARSLVYEPALLLLDEPLSNLDAQLRLRLRDDLRRIIKQAGVTALYVTHDQAEAVVLGDRIGVMRDGKLLQMASAGSNLQSTRRSVCCELHRRLESARWSCSRPYGRVWHRSIRVRRAPHGLAAGRCASRGYGHGCGPPGKRAARRLWRR